MGGGEGSVLWDAVTRSNAQTLEGLLGANSDPTSYWLCGLWLFSLSASVSSHVKWEE